ncbi:phage tail tube protein [Caloramator sp. ALD01]|uniref:phage tail tube protein n=1 Tax=Caloramator sp. ALD01 TaxID=1031288 RepID=UPI000402C7D1|nr:phage tail tube protein [Caloramator sp. ALD01]
MAIRTGRKGNIKVKNGATSVAIAKMGSWKLSIKQGLIDASHFGDDGWESSVPGTKSWSCDIDGSWDVMDASTNQKLLQEALINGTEIELELYVDETETNAKYTGKAYIEEISIDTAAKDLIKISVKTKGNGPLTMPTVA